MYITPSELKNFNEEALQRFVERGIPENYYLDYKVNISGKTLDRQHQEFLKDVTAFANAHGGDILIGVKEPKKGLLPTDQIVGIDNGSDIAQRLTNVAFTCIDPRIPGLSVLTINLSNSKDVILVHIPPSLAKPHMIGFKGGGIRDFYLRANDSSRPMSSFEIRQSVLNSATAEVKAAEYMRKKEIDALYYFIKDRPAFLIQAMPIIPPEQPIDVLSDTTKDIFRGLNTQRVVKCSACPYPTIDGVQGEETLNNHLRFHGLYGYNWRLDFDRNGFISLSNKVPSNDSGTSELARRDGMWFQSFCEISDELTTASAIDVPYLMRCKYVNAKSTMLTGIPYIKDEIEWPDHIRQPGESFIPIANIWLEQMFHAFGEELPIR